MSFPDLTADLAARMPDLRGRLLANQDMTPLTWFRVGGPAQVLFTPADEDDLAYFLKNLPKDIPVYPVGVGSNLIVRDGGMPGVVIRLDRARLRRSGCRRRYCAHRHGGARQKGGGSRFEAGIGGMEFYYGIPGSIGGALRMNAGANGGETKDILIEARGINRKGEKLTLLQRRYEIRLSQLRRRGRRDFHAGDVSRAHRRSGGHSRAHGRRATASRDGAADPRENRRLDLQESAGSFVMEAD